KIKILTLLSTKFHFAALRSKCSIKQDGYRINNKLFVEQNDRRVNEEVDQRFAKMKSKSHNFWVLKTMMTTMMVSGRLCQREKEKVIEKDRVTVERIRSIVSIESQLSTFKERRARKVLLG
ncbi:hypothetical protein V1478_004496, partial [Vespula squamosa]